MPRISTKDAVICDVSIPKGTNVAWSARACLRSQEVFGIDANAYNPDRWLLADADQYQLMDNTVDLCFGQGRWGCLGRPIALVELNKMIFEVSAQMDDLMPLCSIS